MGAVATALEALLQDALSLDADNTGDGCTLMDALPAPAELSPERLLLRADNVVPLLRGVALLKPQERIVITMRFGLNGHDEHTLEKVGLYMGVSKERVRQVQKVAMVKLKEYVATGRMPSIYFDGAQIKELVGRGRRTNGNGAGHS